MTGNCYIATAKKYFVLSLGCFLIMGLLMGGRCREVQEALARRIAPAVLRFHVLAESDGRQDQEVKLEVRSLILDYVRGQLSPEADRDDTVEFVENHAGEIEAVADRYLRERGMDYQTSVEITNCYFPARAYGNFTFPCGYYDAVRVTLGSGRGHDWWCVMYPPLCFTDATCCEFPEESREILERQLTETEYLSLRKDVKIKFKLFELLENH